MLINCMPSHCFGHSDREAVRRYEELSDIFSDKDNYSQSRELLKEVSFCQDIMFFKKTGNQAANDDVIHIMQPK